MAIDFPRSGQVRFGPDVEWLPEEIFPGLEVDEARWYTAGMFHKAQGPDGRQRMALNKLLLIKWMTERVRLSTQRWGTVSWAVLVGYNCGFQAVQLDDTGKGSCNFFAQRKRHGQKLDAVDNLNTVNYKMTNN